MRLPWQLATINVKRLHLINCNIYDESCCGRDSNYLPQIYQELVKNPYIETLKLDEQFISSYDNKDYLIPRLTENTFFNELLKMTSLRTLIIPVPDYLNFEHLREYLTNKKCKLQNLKLTTGLTPYQMTEIPKMLSIANSLKTYKGAGDKDYQKILDNNWAGKSESPQSNQLLNFN